MLPGPSGWRMPMNSAEYAQRNCSWRKVRTCKDALSNEQEATVADLVA